jgi:MFS family permease
MKNKKQIAKRNIRIQGWINFLAGVTFLVPIITIFYQYTGLSLVEIVIISNVSTFVVWLLELPTSVLADTCGRKKSMITSVFCNFFGALALLLIPSFFGFIIAAIFSALYWSFWSGTGQAFLEENLRAIGQEKTFGKVIGDYMFREKLAILVTPLLASGTLKLFGDTGYTLLAALDVFSALCLIFLTLTLKEITSTSIKFKNFKHLLSVNIQTAKDALTNIWNNSKLRFLLIYRSIGCRIGYFSLLLLPILIKGGMPEWYAGIIIMIATVFEMISSKYAYIIGEKFSYNKSWWLSSIMQGVLIIIVGFLLDSWIFVAIAFFIYSIFEGLWQPAWNHVLVEQTQGKALATTRSIVFSVYALYITVGKQLLSFITIKYALIGFGVFIVVANILMRKKIVEL